MKDIKVSVIIPVFNSSKGLGSLINELFVQLKNNYKSYEVILIDDKSVDSTWEVVTKLCKVHNWIKAIKLRKNVGQHNAILAGLKFADGQYIVTMDDDGQNSPNDIVNLVLEIIDALTCERAPLRNLLSVLSLIVGGITPQIIIF